MNNKGTVVSVSGNNVSLTHDDGTKSTRRVDSEANVTLNSKSAELSDLHAGDVVTLTGDPASTVRATRSFPKAVASLEGPVEVKGTITGIAENSLSLRIDSDPTHGIAADATVTLNGKTAKLSDLHSGDKVTLSFAAPVTGVVATR